MIFDALAFPWIFFDSGGLIMVEGHGSLFDTSIEEFSVLQISHFSRLKGGWSRCPSGYAVYSRLVSAANISVGRSGVLVLPNLKVRGRSTAQGKSAGLTINTDERHIERHVEAVLGVQTSLNENFDRFTRQNIHELRGLNSGLYNAAEEIKRLVSESAKAGGKEDNLAKSIVALSQLVSVRLDFMNYISDEGENETRVCEIQVYPKFDKIRRCFLAQAEKKKIEIKMAGLNFSATVDPDNLIEIAAYLLLENAIKYSPEYKVIGVEILDQSGFILVKVSSTGPRVADQEVEKIFEMDFRSSEAIRSGRTGSGIDLSVLKRIVTEGFGGKVSVIRGSEIACIRTVYFDQITLVLSFLMA